jgi:hypothetical protein
MFDRRRPATRALPLAGYRPLMTVNDFHCVTLRVTINHQLAFKCSSGRTPVGLAPNVQRQSAAAGFERL